MKCVRGQVLNQAFKLGTGSSKVATLHKNLSPSNRCGVSIVAAVGIMLILSVMGLTGISLLGATSGLAVDYMNAQQAFYISEAGLEWYSKQLEADDDWSDNASLTANNFANGSFTITVSNCQASSIDVVSTATVAGYENQPAQRVLSEHLNKSIAAFDYAIYASGDINTQQATDLTITGDTEFGVTGLPVIDFSYYEDIADHKVYENTAFNAGTYSGVWYIEGNVTINSNVTINGSIIATGNVGIPKDGTNVTISAVSPYPALICEGNFNFGNDTSNITITGLVYIGADMNGNFLAQKTTDFTVIGVIIVGGNFNLQQSDNVTITYQSPGGDVPGISGGGSPVSSSWQEVL